MEIKINPHLFSNSQYWFLLGLLMLSCYQEKLFENVHHHKTGIDFINWNNETEETNILRYEYLYNGGGVALGDINNDGLLDIYLSSNSGENRLYLNEGGFRFKDITQTSGTACRKGWKTGVSFIDINADGWVDIYVCKSANNNPDKRRNVLLINNRDNTFTDQAREYGLDDPSYTSQAAFFDFDRDNDLDVFLLNHSLLEISNSYDITARNSTARTPYVGNKLLENRDGLFIDVSDSLGIYGPGSNYGLGVSLSDLNNDGWIDIYAGCDYTGRDKLLINCGGNFFKDVTHTALSHISKFTMGMDIGDINNDGEMDILTLDMLPEDNTRQKQLFGSDRYDVYAAMVESGLHHQYMRNMLHMNNGDGTYSEVGQLAGLSNTDWSWSALIADFDNDGFNDVFVTNGFKRDLTDNDFAKYNAFEEIHRARKEGRSISSLEVIEKFTENKIPNYMYRGHSELRFEDMSARWGFGEATLSNGAAYGDLDNDGDLDLVVNNINDHAGMYMNNSNMRKESNYLRVELKGSNGNTMAIGSRVSVWFDGRQAVRETFGVRGFQSSVDPILHFGLGECKKIDSLVVRWPDGTYTRLENISVNKKVEIAQRSSGFIPRSRKAKPLFSREWLSDTIAHAENDFNDFRIQPLLPRMYSREGPAMAMSDVNGDGEPDLFVGAAKKGTAKILTRRDVKFVQHEVYNGRADQVDAAFFDADGDGDQDLYVVTGGYDAAPDSPGLQDLLLINNGQGQFKEKPLPDFRTSGSRVRFADVEMDGDIDVFVPGRLVPGQYPRCPESVLLLNDGNAQFSIAPLNDKLKTAGMITDAQFVNLNDDLYPDLVVVGEWMPVRFFVNEKGKFVERSNEYLASGSEGLWNCILPHDFDEDGDLDLFAGNYGLNSQWHASESEPLELVYDDFDENGSVDPIVSCYKDGVSFPFPSRDELLEQVPVFKKHFTTYTAYATVTQAELVKKVSRSTSTVLKAHTLEHALFRNDEGRFTMVAMPRNTQIAPISAMSLMDTDNDGVKELILAGNLETARARTGKVTGNRGVVMKFIQGGMFELVNYKHSGLSVDGEVRHIVNDGSRIYFAINNDELKIYKLILPIH